MHLKGINEYQRQEIIIDPYHEVVGYKRMKEDAKRLYRLFQDSLPAGTLYHFKKLILKEKCAIEIIKNSRQVCGDMKERRADPKWHEPRG